MANGDAATSSIVLCIENELYRDYLEQQFAAQETPLVSIGRDELAKAIAEQPSPVLLLQSDSDEHSLIELSAKLKRIFGDEIRVLFLSSDYRTEDEAASRVDHFLQFPVGFEQVQEAVCALQDTTRRILIIDDSRLVHNHLRPPLEAEGYEVFGAFDGEEGLQQAHECHPDLIICDIEMPKMNGFEACAAMRAAPELADIYIIMSSTLGSMADQQRGFQAGVDEYITKPVVIPELLDRLRKIFSSSRTGRESILVLEGEEQLGKVIAKALTNQGFAARTADSIRHALRICRKIEYELVITPTMLSDGTMLDLLSALESLPAGRQPDALVLTSRDNAADEKVVMNAGAAGVVSQPFTTDGLLAAVESALADRRAAQEKAQLQKYVSKSSMRMAIEKSILSGASAEARAYRKSATIFFSDVAGFTSRCEKYPPQEIVNQINAMFATMTRIIMESDGDIDKFIGDACMAYWLDDDPEVSADKALRATLRIWRELERMNRENTALAADPIKIRVGLNTGEIILCDIGSADARIDLTIIGDPVNVAARFESAGKQYGVGNLVSAITIGPHLDRFAARSIDLVKVKGKSEPLECYEMFGEIDQLTEQQQELVDKFATGIGAYRRGDFEQGLALFQESEELEAVREEGELNPSRVYIDRCRQLIAEPPEDWQGVWELKAK